MTSPFPHPLILGHRGAPLRAPENTLRAFALALEQGADGVELDVRRSRDGVPVVIHDETLERTLQIRGAVGALDWPALERLSGAQLPSLEQAAAWAAAAGAWLNVELKAAGAEQAALDVLARTEMLERTFVSSFDAAVVREVGRLAPEVPRFLLTESWDEGAHEALVECGARGVCLRVDAATPLALDVLRNEAIPVVVWTVDDPARMRELLRAEVAALITHDPAAGVEARREVLGAPRPGPNSPN